MIHCALDHSAKITPSTMAASSSILHKSNRADKRKVAVKSLVPLIKGLIPGLSRMFNFARAQSTFADERAFEWEHWFHGYR